MMAVQPCELTYCGHTHGVLLCTTTDRVFGPLFPSLAAADAFLDWLGCDPRKATDLDAMAARFLSPAKCEWEACANDGTAAMYRLFAGGDLNHPSVIAICPRCAAAIKSRLDGAIAHDGDGDNDDDELERIECVS